mmetsp:Transcript_14764/g.49066  ORF Transcript_14764/g.49066 Transcript_14764/m.49066 type:complete len:213 (+) Transcript_14764:1405-2043(+)
MRATFASGVSTAAICPTRPGSVCAVAPEMICQLKPASRTRAPEGARRWRPLTRKRSGTCDGGGGEGGGGSGDGGSGGSGRTGRGGEDAATTLARKAVSARPATMRPSPEAASAACTPPVQLEAAPTGCGSVRKSVPSSSSVERPCVRLVACPWLLVSLLSGAKRTALRPRPSASCMSVRRHQGRRVGALAGAGQGRVEIAGAGQVRPAFSCR